MDVRLFLSRCELTGPCPAGQGAAFVGGLVAFLCRSLLGEGTRVWSVNMYDRIIFDIPSCHCKVTCPNLHLEKIVVQYSFFCCFFFVGMILYDIHWYYLMFDETWSSWPAKASEVHTAVVELAFHTFGMIPDKIPQVKAQSEFDKWGSVCCSNHLKSVHFNAVRPQDTSYMVITYGQFIPHGTRMYILYYIILWYTYGIPHLYI